MKILLTVAIICFSFYGNILLQIKKDPYFLENSFCYFTSLSNLAVMSFQICILFSYHFDFFIQVANNSFISYMVTNGITITFIIFAFVLYPIFKKKNNNIKDSSKKRKILSADCICVHYIVPILQITWWILYSSKELKFEQTFYSLLFPLGYILFILVRVLFKRKLPGRNTCYPYPYVDPEQVGKKGFSIGIIGSLFIMFIVNIINYWIATHI